MCTALIYPNILVGLVVFSFVAVLAGETERRRLKRCFPKCGVATFGAVGLVPQTAAHVARFKSASPGISIAAARTSQLTGQCKQYCPDTSMAGQHHPYLDRRRHAFGV